MAAGLMFIVTNDDGYGREKLGRKRRRRVSLLLKGTDTDM